MQDPIIRLTAADMPELLPFLSAAFIYDTVTFDKLLPSIYRADDEAMRANFAIRHHGDLAAVVGMFPIEWRVGGVPLKLAGIGGVSTGNQYRGQGHMRRLMDAVMEEARAGGYHASYLGGQRQRYGYWGYERCGTELAFTITSGNLKHALPGLPAVSIHPVAADSPDLPALQALHDRQELRAERPAPRFRDYLRCWKREPWVGRRADGSIAGYLAGSATDGDLTELVAETTDDALHLIRAWMTHTNGKASFRLAPLPGELVSRLDSIADDLRVGASGNWLIFDWPAVITAMLRLKHRLQPLAEGRVVIAAGKQRLALTIEGNDAVCEATTATPDLELPEMTMLRLLTGPAAPDVVSPLSGRAALLRAWCPLPLFLPPPDHV